MKKNLTEMVFILDKSGSMAGMENDNSKRKVPYKRGHLPFLCCFSHTVSEYFPTSSPYPF